MLTERNVPMRPSPLTLNQILTISLTLTLFQSFTLILTLTKEFDDDDSEEDEVRVVLGFDFGLRITVKDYS